MRALSRQLPRFPGAVGGIVHRDVAAIPFADPEAAFGIRPYPPGTLIGRRRLHDRRVPGRRIDFGDMAAGERGVPDVALRRDGDAVGPDAPWRLEHRDVTGLRIEPAVKAGLA